MSEEQAGVEFFIAARLRTKGNSMKIHRRGNRRWISPTDEQKAAEHAVRILATPYAPREPLTGPLRLDVTIVVKIPATYKGKKREAAITAALRPDTPDKGDRGNHLKLLEDALEGLFYVNDAQICEGSVRKVFGEESGYQVTIGAIDEKQCIHCEGPIRGKSGVVKRRRFCSLACSARSRRADVLKRAWAKIDKRGPTECWPWVGAKRGKGYGVIYVDNRKRPAHRMLFELINGPIPTDLVVMHSCDNPPCCNPAHLSLGTVRDNAMDMVAKGRGRVPMGAHSNLAKLTAQDVLDIRAAHGDGELQVDIADRFRVTRGNISAIVNRKSWKHVPEPNGATT